MTGSTFSLKGISVALVMSVHRDLDWEVAKSLSETNSILNGKGIPLKVMMQVGSSIVEAARTRAVHEFLKTDANRLFWIDSDIVWRTEDFLRLLCFSTKMQVVGAAYPAKREPANFFMGGLVDELSNEYGCLSVKGMGLGFTIVSRQIIEALAKKAPLMRFPDVDEPIPHIFRCDTTGELFFTEDGTPYSEFRGEDMAFFADIIALGHEVWCDPSITLGHVGRKAYEGKLMDYLIKEPLGDLI